MATNNSVNSPLSGTTGSGNFVGSASPALTNPDINAIYNTNLTLAFGNAASAVNYLQITNAATGNPVSLTAQGTDTNIPLYLAGKGATQIRFGNDLLMYNPAGGNNYTVFNTIASGAQTVTVPSLSGTMALSGASQDVSFNSVSWSDTTKGIVGTTTNNNAGAGYVGEYLSATNSTGTTVNNATATNITTISLTAGDWDVYYLLNCAPANTNVFNLLYTGISPISVSIDLLSGAATWFGSFTGDGSSALVLNGSRRVSISTTTTYYLISYHSSSAGTLTTTDKGTIWARRVR
jgi:hypothetical protein